MIDLLDVTFLIPVRIDHTDRVENLDLVVDYIFSKFDTNIFIYEEDISPKYVPKTSKVIYKYIRTENKNLHRTKLLNMMTKHSKTPIIVNYDTDVFLYEDKYIDATNLIRSKKYDVVYPYSGKFCDVDRNPNLKYIKEDLTLDRVDTSKYFFHPCSVGGAIFCNKEKYILSGMENENFINYGYEDQERISRFQKIGLHIYRLDGNLVHLKHYRGPNSNLNNDCSSKNEQEFKKIENMSTEEVLTYVRERV